MPGGHTADPGGELVRQEEILEILRNSVSPLTKYDIAERAGVEMDETSSQNIGPRLRALEKWGQVYTWQVSEKGREAVQ